MFFQHHSNFIKSQLCKIRRGSKELRPAVFVIAVKYWTFRAFPLFELFYVFRVADNHSDMILSCIGQLSNAFCEGKRCR